MDARAEALSALARFQVTETTLGEALQRIAEITLEGIAAADVVGMSMLGENGRPTTAGADEHPVFAAACVDHGVQSTVSLPMTAGDAAVGAPHHYSHIAEQAKGDLG